MTLCSQQFLVSPVVGSDTGEDGELSDQFQRDPDDIL